MGIKIQLRLLLFLLWTRVKPCEIRLEVRRKKLGPPGMPASATRGKRKYIVAKDAAMQDRNSLEFCIVGDGVMHMHVSISCMGFC